MTQGEFADHVGYSRTAVSNMESGNYSVTDNFLNKVEEVFGIDLAEFKSYNRKAVVNEQSVSGEYNVDWKDKYYSLMEEHLALLKEIKAQTDREKGGIGGTE